MADLPEPLVPAGIDLRDFLFTPIEFGRLFTSETWVMSNDAEKVAAITLWGKSWTEVPAGSIPSEDRMLEHLSGAGSKWKRVKPMAMRGWVLCNDSRYYHPVMCEKALEAWLEKLAQRLSSGAGNARRWGAVFDAAGIAAEYLGTRDMIAAINPKSRALAKRIPKTIQDALSGSPDGNAAGSPDGTPKPVPTGSQGTGTGTGNIKPSLSAHDDRLDDPRLTGYHPADWQPNPDQLATLLHTHGKPMPDPAQLETSRVNFNLHFSGKPLSARETHPRFVRWLLEDISRGQQTQARPGTAAGQPAARKLTPVEQAERDRDQFLRDNGIDPASAGIRR